MRVYLTCKLCGKKRSFIWSDSRLPDPEKALQEGWSSDGEDLYCRDCAMEVLEVSNKKVTEVMWRKLWKQMPKRRKEK